MSDPTRVIVSLVVNGDHGMPTGHVEKADFSLANDTVLELESQWWWDEDEALEEWASNENTPKPACPHPRFEYDEARHVIRVDGHTFQVLGHRAHVGNIYWDGFLMSLRSSRALAKHLLKLGWQPDNYSETEGEFALNTLRESENLNSRSSSIGHQTDAPSALSGEART